MRYVETDKTVAVCPDFVHEFGNDNESLSPTDHTYRGSFLRHIAFEKPLLKLKHLLDNIGDACPTYKWLNAFIGIVLGFNCGFPRRDIALYTLWCLDLYKPILYENKLPEAIAFSKTKEIENG